MESSMVYPRVQWNFCGGPQHGPHICVGLHFEIMFLPLANFTLPMKNNHQNTNSSAFVPKSTVESYVWWRSVRLLKMNLAIVAKSQLCNRIPVFIGACMWSLHALAFEKKQNCFYSGMTKQMKTKPLWYLKTLQGATSCASSITWVLCLTLLSMAV